MLDGARLRRLSWPRRWLFVGIAALALGQIVVWLLAGSIVWTFRNVMVGAASPQAQANARLAIAIFLAAGLIAVAFAAFLAWPRPSTRLLLLAVQTSALAVTLIQGAVRSSTWLVLSILSLFTIALLFVGPRQARAE
jgi:hypothetical protein